MDASPDASRNTDAALADAALVDGGAPQGSVRCGDGIRGLDEECDDGNDDESDFCTAACRVADRLAVLSPPQPVFPREKRTPAGGHHVVAGTRNSAAALYVDELEPALGVALYAKNGARIGGDDGFWWNDGRTPYHGPDTETAIVALPGDRYALLWTAIGTPGDAVGVWLRGMDGTTGALAPSIEVNAQNGYGQTRVDAAWTGSELDVVWDGQVGGSFNSAGKLRRFDAALNPLGGEEPLTSDPDYFASPTITAFGQGHAAMWRDMNDDSTFALRIEAGSAEWTVPRVPVFDDYVFQLEALDATHLLALWTSVDYRDGGPGVAHVHGAVLATDQTGVVEPFEIEPLNPKFQAGDDDRGAHRPSLVVAGGSAYVAWFLDVDAVIRTPAVHVMKEMPWRSGQLDLSLLEIEVPRDGGSGTIFSGVTQLGFVPWTPGGALLALWGDDSSALGSLELRPDALTELIPLPILRYPEMSGENDGGP